MAAENREVYFGIKEHKKSGWQVYFTTYQPIIFQLFTLEFRVNIRLILFFVEEIFNICISAFYVIIEDYRQANLAMKSYKMLIELMIFQVF